MTTLMSLKEEEKKTMMVPSSTRMSVGSSCSRHATNRSSVCNVNDNDNNSEYCEDNDHDWTLWRRFVGSISRGGAFIQHPASASVPNKSVNKYPKTQVHGHSNSSSSSSDTTSRRESTEKLHPLKDEPNLYNLPTSIRPEYQTVPIVVKMILGFVSVLLSSIRSSTTLGSIGKAPLRKLRFVFKAFVYFILSMAAVQDLFYAPSRISMTALLGNTWLPSRFSQYSIVHAAVPQQLVYKEDVGRLQIDPIGVHFLEYKNDAKSLVDVDDDKYTFDAIHFNHGFGASSLSWLPAIPSLVQKLNGKLGLAHDAPGFGFTDRPVSSGKKGGLVPYSSAANAAIGNVLLTNRWLGDEEKIKRVALFGHSMGCSATLKMALTLPLEVEKVVVLVAPALVGEFQDDKDDSKEEGDGLSPSQEVQKSVEQLVQSQPSRVREVVAKFLAVIRTVVLDFGVMYVLRRLVGRPGFWKNGLRLAWGDPNRLRESDVLRFQWPSIGKGWESGLLSFTRSRIASSCAYRGGEVQLLCDVLRLPNTRVILVQGTKDPIVPVSMAERIADHCQDRIRLIKLDGQGHDPFEESVDVFVQSVLSEIQK